MGDLCLIENLLCCWPPVAAGPKQQGPQQAVPGELLRPLLQPLGQLLYDALRPRLVQLQDIDLLCELIDILHHEVGVSGCSPPLPSPPLPSVASILLDPVSI